MVLILNSKKIEIYFYNQKLKVEKLGSSSFTSF